MAVKWSRVSLRSLLVVPFVLQLAGLVGIVGYLSFRNSQRAIADLASQLRQELTNRIQQQMRTYVDLPQRVIHLNGSALQHGLINLETGQGSALIWQQVVQFPNLSNVYCGGEAGGEFMGVARFQDNEPLVLSLINPAINYRRHYYALNAQGEPTQLLRTRQFDPRARPWYKAAKAAGRAIWSDTYIDFNTNLPTITAALPVYSLAGNQLLGVCAIDLFLHKEVSNFLTQLRISPSGQAFVIERSGLLVSSSLGEPLVQGQGEHRERVSAIASQSPLIQATTQYLTTQFSHLNQIQTNQQLNFRRDDGSLQWVQVTPFVDKRGLDWLIVVVVPAADFMTQIQANTQRTISLSLLALLLATGVGLVTAHWIATPILHLNTAAQAIADGDLDQRVQVKGVRELKTLSDSFNRMAEQLRTFFAALAAANAELEQQVAQRTFELQAANQEITHLNEQLAAENQRLGTELDVARRLQRLLLPKEEELQAIAGLQIAGFMEPAAEVGGDYYDVLQYDGKVKIGIGDVTGHGLGSGVLMLMVQTAVRTLLVNQETDPVKFLGTLNRALYDNLQRMQSDKNLTLALLEYEAGHLRLSGQHEELILVRATGKVERIDTIDLGFPLGLEPDITAFVAETALQLHRGDVVVLYTDGITEAMNAERQQYGPDRLCQVVQTHASRSAQEIRQAVLENVWRYVGDEPLRDDLTLLVLKQL